MSPAPGADDAVRVIAIRQSAPGRLLVCLDDGGEILSTPGTVTELRLAVGRELDVEGLERLRRASLLALAREKALELVSRRPLSRRELAGKLRQRGFDADTAEACVAWIAEHGFIDEPGYAAAVVRHCAAKGFGAARVRAELMRRGIPRELLDEALAAMPEDGAKLDRLIAARLKDPADRDAVRKLSAALYRRGYSGEEIRAALARFHTDIED